ncbi:MAG: hypothetical protein WCS86_01090 [Candidatus Paceibacterota bacterium]
MIVNIAKVELLLDITLEMSKASHGAANIRAYDKISGVIPYFLCKIGTNFSIFSEFPFCIASLV